MTNVLFRSATRVPSPSPRAKGGAVLFLALCAAGAALAERQPFERYQTIVDRQMFGPPPEGFDPTKPPSEAVSSRNAQREAQELTKEQEKLKSAIHFSMINVTPAGETAVGFTDSSDPKVPVNYYLRVGESRGGWTVKEADPVASSMTIVKDDVEVSLTIGGNSAKGAGKTAAASRGGSGGSAPTTGASLGSLRSRRAQRRAEENARMEEISRKMQEREAALEKRQQEDAARREEEKAVREAEREEQNKQLQQMMDELRRTREEKEKAEKAKEQAEKPGSDDSQS